MLDLKKYFKNVEILYRVLTLSMHIICDTQSLVLLELTTTTTTKNRALVNSFNKRDFFVKILSS